MKNILFVSVLTLVSFNALADFELETILHSQQTELETQLENFDEENVDELNTEQIKSTNAGSASIDDILSLSNTATTARGPRSSGEAPQIRGLDDNKIFVMIDGHRQNFQAGHTSMVALDTENLKAAEVHKSSASISNAGSLGGGVNFITKDAEDFLVKGKNNGSEFKTRYNSVNAENSLNAKYIYKDRDRSGYVSMSTATAQNTQLNNGETLPYSSYEDKSILIKNRYKNFGLKLELFERQDDAPMNPALTPPDSRRSLLSNNTTTKTNVSVDYRKKALTATAYFNRYQSDKTALDDKQTTSKRHDTTGVKFKNVEDNWHYGAEAYQDKLNSEFNGEEILSYPLATGTNYHLYGEKRFLMGKKTSLTPGLRFSAYELTAENDMPRKSDSAITRKINLTHNWTPNLKTFITVSEGFNAPRVNEVFPSGLHNPGDGFVFRDNFFIPNQDLQAETSLNKEFGVSYEASAFKGNGLVAFNLNAYENKIKDFIYMERIDRSVADPTDGTTQFVNLPNVSMYGGEAELKVLYGMVETSVSYTKVRGKNETLNLYLQDLPADQYNYRVNYYLDKHQLTIGYLGQQALEQHRINPETIQRNEKTDSYFIHNMYVNKRIDNFDINFGIDNMTNVEYRRHAAFLNETAANYKLALTYKVNTL